MCSRLPVSLPVIGTTLMEEENKCVVEILFNRVKKERDSKNVNTMLRRVEALLNALCWICLFHRG
jgi:hypothetical protein